MLAKAPVPGRVKTRLSPPFSRDEAADLAAAALTDTLAAVRAAAHRSPGLVPLLVLDGDPQPDSAWWPADMTVLPQRGAGHDERIAAAFTDAYAVHRAPALLIGMDTPQVTADLLASAAAMLARPGAVLGPAADGGWWALGLRRPDPRLILGVPMSTAVTGDRQRERLLAAGLTVRPLPELRDVDTAADCYAVAFGAPDLVFARRLAATRRPVAAVR